MIRDGVSTVFQQLPVSALKKDCLLLINPGSTITPEVILREIEMTNSQNRVKIHPHASVVTPSAREMEAKMLKRIASTLKGVGATLGMKAMRHPEVVLAKDVASLRPFLGDTTNFLHGGMRAGQMILAEGAQGFDLSLNHGYQYPYVTSRDVTTCNILANSGVPPRLVGDIYASIRTYPIRVGNHIENGKMLGTSGPHYTDQIEVDWDHVRKSSGAESDQTEITTVTKKVRRVFTFSKAQFKRFLRVCGPTHVFINFINHISVDAYGVRTWSELPATAKAFVTAVENQCYEYTNEAGGECRVSHIGTGPDEVHMVDLEL